MILDFKEIPKANTGSGHQDTFELFARDFLKNVGYEIVNNPSRGADGGIDLKIKENRVGVSNQKTEIYWLVSCKHYAHSGVSINSTIEQDIHDRVISNKCDAFMGFYSTIPSQALLNKLKGLSAKIQYLTYDSARIENEIVGYNSMEPIFKRYFPNSFKKWKQLEYFREPIKLFEFYCKNKYLYDNGISNDIDYFLKIFINIENIYKAIKSSKNFHQFISHNNIRYIVVNSFVPLINSLAEQHKKNIQIISEKSYTDSRNYLHNLLGQHIANKNKISIRAEIGLVYYLNNQPSYFLFSNMLCVSQKMDKRLNEIYKELTNIMN